MKNGKSKVLKPLSSDFSAPVEKENERLFPRDAKSKTSSNPTVLLPYDGKNVAGDASSAPERGNDSKRKARRLPRVAEFLFRDKRNSDSGVEDLQMFLRCRYPDSSTGKEDDEPDF